MYHIYIYIYIHIYIYIYICVIHHRHESKRLSRTYGHGAWPRRGEPYAQSSYILIVLESDPLKSTMSVGGLTNIA